MTGGAELDVHPWATGLARKFWEQTWRPASTIHVSWIRVVVFGMFAYKLLSRDFSVFGYAPAFLLELYPTDLFSPDDDFLMLGFKPIVDVATFHWIHWILPMPGAAILGFLQFGVVGACLCVVLFGRGPHRLFAISAYCGLAYLFGYLWRAGHDVDAVFVALQIALLYCFTRHEELTLLERPSSDFSRHAGWFYSMSLLCFVGYYFLSGVNKVTDLPIMDWFRYGLVNEILFFSDKVAAGSIQAAPSFFGYIDGHNWIDILGVPAVYISHLAIPLMYFRRVYISGFFFFYLLFHFMATGVGILFFGLLITWLALLPVHRLTMNVTVALRSNAGLLAESVGLMQRMAMFGRIKICDPAMSVPDRAAIAVSEPADGQVFSDFRGIRRMLWLCPFAWPLLLILYVPGLSHAIGSIFGFIVRAKAETA